MDTSFIIKHAVNKAYFNLISILKVKANVCGGYLGIIIPRDNKEITKHTDEIINQLFWKMCKEISSKITKKDIKLVTYRSFSLNKPSENLINDCFKIVNDSITNKKSSNETTLYSLLNQLREKHSKKDLENSFDTVFDILLDYYSMLN